MLGVIGPMSSKVSDKTQVNLILVLLTTVYYEWFIQVHSPAAANEMAFAIAPVYAVTYYTALFFTAFTINIGSLLPGYGDMSSHEAGSNCPE